VAAVAHLAHKVPQVIPMAGLPMGETAWVIDHAALYLGVDTGITHLAGVLQQKSLVLSHFRIPTWRPTYNPNARAIANSKRCECAQGGACEIKDGGIAYTRCMYDISDEFMIDSVRLALTSASRNVPSFPGFVDETL